MQEQKLSQAEIQKILKNLTDVISKEYPQGENIVLLGIQRRGSDLAKRIGRMLSKAWGHEAPVGSIDINLYRDDWTKLAAE